MSEFPFNNMLHTVNETSGAAWCCWWLCRKNYRKSSSVTIALRKYQENQMPWSKEPHWLASHRFPTPGQPNAYRPGLFKFFGRDHISYCTTFRGPDTLRNVTFSGCATFRQIKHIFRKYIVSLLAKCVLRPGEMASQVGFGPWAVVWRTLI